MPGRKRLALLVDHIAAVHEVVPIERQLRMHQLFDRSVRQQNFGVGTKHHDPHIRRIDQVADALMLQILRVLSCLP